MRRSVPKIWCFLLYWVFLVNFGPSFHQSDLFGLHSHPFGAANCGSHHHNPNLRCCDHNDSADTGHNHGGSQPNEALIVSVAADVDCLCCKFFDQYNVCFSCVEFLDTESAGTEVFSFSEGRPSAGDFEALARGPPASIAQG